ncbi:hypothetical protein EVAR_571_1 [Eumeta japonica]|uniref:Uncharacterized protein n=1 Tax=Eumeta variegata TaxID=151549 RepID=A0A4C1SBU9_EUMVA|nr:hypothetical protein EVAR_571_1 [Eumeta japonica]
MDSGDGYRSLHWRLVMRLNCIVATYVLDSVQVDKAGSQVEEISPGGTRRGACACANERGHRPGPEDRDPRARSRVGIINRHKLANVLRKAIISGSKAVLFYDLGRSVPRPKVRRRWRRPENPIRKLPLVTIYDTELNRRRPHAGRGSRVTRAVTRSLERARVSLALRDMYSRLRPRCVLMFRCRTSPFAGGIGRPFMETHIKFVLPIAMDLEENKIKNTGGRPTHRRAAGRHAPP